MSWKKLKISHLILKYLSTACFRVGLAMNRSKIKAMTSCSKRRVDDGQEIQYVDEYIYLGQIVTFVNAQEKEINRRIGNAWKSYWSMKTLMKRDLPISLKRKLIDRSVAHRVAEVPPWSVKVPKSNEGRHSGCMNNRRNTEHHTALQNWNS